MSFSINTNVSSLTANLNSGVANSAVNKSLGMLSSGSQLGSASYDAAGLGIANRLSAQVSGLGQAIMNSNESMGMMQIADGAMQGINDIMQRVRTLTLQASNDTMGVDDRATIQKEIDALSKSADDIAKQTSYNGIKLLDGTGGSFGNGTFVTQSGANGGESQSIQIGNATTASLLGTIDITTASGRVSALDSVDNALKNIGDIRSNLGASQNQLIANINNISVAQINSAAAESNMRDIDFAQESANFSRANILSQIGSFTQAQSNASAANITRLFG
jgi:flagellin